jgi:hypothetical protein
MIGVFTSGGSYVFPCSFSLTRVVVPDPPVKAPPAGLSTVFLTMAVLFGYTAGSKQWFPLGVVG